jgi:hypothetical protein
MWNNIFFPGNRNAASALDYFWDKYFHRVADRTFEIWNAHFLEGRTELIPYPDDGYTYARKSYGQDIQIIPGETPTDSQIDSHLAYARAVNALRGK